MAITEGTMTEVQEVHEPVAVDVLATVRQEHQAAVEKKTDLAKRLDLLKRGLAEHEEARRALLVRLANGEAVSAGIDALDAAILSTKRETEAVTILAAQAEQEFDETHARLVAATNEAEKQAQERAFAELEAKVREASRAVVSAYEGLAVKMWEFERLAAQLDEQKQGAGYKHIISLEPQKKAFLKGYEKRGRLEFAVAAMRPPKSG